MSQERQEGASAAESKAEEVGGWRRWPRMAENFVVAFALAAAVVLPLLEILLRAGFETGLPGSGAFVQHLTLVIGMLGGALAARDGRLLSISTVTTFLKGKAKWWATVISSALSAVISVFLCQASIQFLRTEEKMLAFDIPVWVVQLVLPIGFGLVALRLFWLSSEVWKGRLISLALAGAVAAGILWLPVEPGDMVWPGLGLVLLAAVLGAPIFAIIGGVTLVLLWSIDSPIAAIPLKHYSLVTNPSLPTIPLFTLAGYFLAEGGASRRLVRVFNALVGQLRGGPAIVVVLVCAFFTSFTGASGVTILALGGLLLPVLRSAGYTERNALGLMTGSGSLGVLFPPCLPLILYAIIASTVVANMDVEGASAGTIGMKEMFLAGAVPGALLVLLTGWLGVWQGPKEAADRPHFEMGEARAAVWDAKWELLLPVVALVALFSGYATPVEAAAVTAAYAFLVEAVIYRDLKLFKDVPRVLTECGLLIGGVLLILGVAMGFTNYLVTEEIPDRAVEWVKGSVEISEDDIRDLPSLARKLQEQSDPVSHYLMEQFSDETRADLMGFVATGMDADIALFALVDEFTELMEYGEIYEEQRFAGMTLSAQARALIAEQPSGDGLVRLNRILLQEVYPVEIKAMGGAIESPIVFLLVLNVFLLLVGCLMDIYSAIVVVVPLIVPMGIAFGIDPLHLGIIFLANLQLGYLTPPVGMNLFLASYRFGVPITTVMRSVLPILLVLAIGVLLITYVPALSTTLPRMLD